MADALGISPGRTMEELDDYLATEGWRPKLDTLAKLGETNAWVYDRFFALGQGGPVGLAVFMLREWVYEKGLADQAVSIIKENGFTVLREKFLPARRKSALLKHCGVVLGEKTLMARTRDGGLLLH